ncbi:MAG: hypothetical protein II008_19125 [Oscillospiraceae bacterium]|nr:hypothetical protein [Oscillospiraceae bacterium]
MTNGDWIRGMTDAELALFLRKLRHRWFCLPGDRTFPKCPLTNCRDCWLRWIREEAEE